MFLRMCNDLNVGWLNKSATEWLVEYVFIMEPLTICLDISQSVINKYFEFLILSITQLISKYSNLKQSGSFNINGSLI